MVVDSILSHAGCGPNDHRKDAPPFKNSGMFDAVLNESLITLKQASPNKRGRQIHLFIKSFKYV